MQDGKNQLNSSKSGKNNNVACELSKVNTVTEKQRGGRSSGGGAEKTGRAVGEGRRALPVLVMINDAVVGSHFRFV